MKRSRYVVVAGLLALQMAGLSVVACSQEVSATAPDQSIQSRLQRMEDVEAIREVVIAYGRHFDNRDFHAYAMLFAKDGEWIGGDTRYKGPAAIQAFVEKIYPPTVNPGAFHIMSSISITLTGEDTATAWSRWTFVTLGDDGELVPFRAGHYEDDLVREGGEWKFRHRRLFSASSTVKQ